MWGILNILKGFWTGMHSFYKDSFFCPMLLGPQAKWKKEIVEHTFIAVHNCAKSWQASSFSLWRLSNVSATRRITFDPSYSRQSQMRRTVCGWTKIQPTKALQVQSPKSRCSSQLITGIVLSLDMSRHSITPKGVGRGYCFVLRHVKTLLHPRGWGRGYCFVLRHVKTLCYTQGEGTQVY